MDQLVNFKMYAPTYLWEDCMMCLEPLRYDELQDAIECTSGCVSEVLRRLPARASRGPLLKEIQEISVEYSIVRQFL